MTHRVFSRNASSSRAIPVARLIQDCIDDPVEPVFWGKNQPGMQAAEELVDEELVQARFAWKQARQSALTNARVMADAGAHKQIVNRILEPFTHINVVVTSTSWANFLHLRDHADSQPEIRVLAQKVRKAIDGSEPTILHRGEWHLPYVLDEERALYHIDTLKKVSAARCARTSYKTHDGGNPVIEKDLELFDRLVGSQPLHASPTEHQATPDDMTYKPFLGFVWDHPEEHGNFTGWRQHRKMLPGEYVAG